MRFLALTATLMAAVFGTIFFWPAESTGSAPVQREATVRPNTFSCTVTKVHDGDGPLWCAEGPKVRLTAIAARELDESCNPGHPCPSASAASAQKALEDLALGEVLRCEATGTSYNRTTAWCWRDDGVELNCAMVEGGYAARWEKFDPERRMCRS